MGNTQINIGLFTGFSDMAAQAKYNKYSGNNFKNTILIENERGFYEMNMEKYLEENYKEELKELGLIKDSIKEKPIKRFFGELERENNNNDR